MRSKANVWAAVVGMFLAFVPALQAQITGSGTPGTLPVFTSSTVLGDSAVVQENVSGTEVRLKLGDLTRRGTLQILGPATSDIWTSYGENYVTGPAVNMGYLGASVGRSVGFMNVRPDALATGHNPSLRFYTVDVPRVIITKNGWVGVGTMNPSAYFHVVGDSTQYMIVERGAKQLYVNANWAGQNNYSQLANRNTDNMGLSLSSKDTSPEYLFVATNGSVGVGTTSPDSTKKLHVVGNARFDGTVTGTNIQAQYQDVAEWVPSRQDLAPGTVVVLDASLGNGVTASSAAYDTAVAGVVSAQPGIILGEASQSKEMIATTGRVKVRVDASRAPIAVGDLLVTSDERGVAMKSQPMDINGRKFHQPGTIIGKALEALADGQGEILVLLSLQ